jgi:hypothetical protein
MFNIFKRKPRPPQRFTEAQEALKKRGGCLVVIWGLFVGLLLLLLATVADIVFSGWVSRQIDPAVDLFWLVAHTPIGVAGLSLVVALCVAVAVGIILAVLDSRPRKPPKPVQLTPEEREAIQALRTMWQRHGHEAAYLLSELHRDVKEVWALKGRWGHLLERAPSLLDNGRDDMTAALADLTRPLEQVQNSFNEMYRAYRATCSNVSRIAEDQELEKTHLKYVERLQRWQAKHHAMFDELLNIETMPAHGRILRFHIRNGFEMDQTLLRFMHAAEVREENQ